MSSSQPKSDTRKRTGVSTYNGNAAKGSPEELLYLMNGMLWEAESQDGQKLQTTFVSPNVVSLLGYPLDRWFNEPGFFEKCLHPDDRPWVVELREKSLREKGSFDLEYRLLAADGRIVWIRSVAQLRPHEKNRFTLRGLAIDITSRKEWQSATEQSEELLSAVISSLRSHIAVLDENGRIIAVNDAWNNFADENGAVSRSKVGVGADYLQICRNALKASSVGADNALVGIRSVLNGSTDYYSHEYVSENHSGIRWFSMAVTPLKRQGGGAVVSHTDITASKEAEQTLHAAEDRNRAFIKAVPDLLFLMTKEGLYLDYYARDPSLLYVTPDKFLGKKISDIMPFDDSWLFLQSFEKAIETGETIIQEYSLNLPNVGLRHFEARVVACHPDHILCIVRDFTERKRTEDELWESRWFNQRINDAMPAVLYLYDRADQKIVYLNKQIASVLGYADHELRQCDLAQLFGLVHTDDLAAITGQFSGLKQVKDGQFVEGDFRVRHKDGSWRYLHLRCTVFSRDDNGNIKEILGTAQDVTERKLAEDRLTESQNRYALATGAGGVSVWDYDLGTGEIYCDSTLSHILGFAEGEKQNLDWLKVIHPEDRYRVLSHGKKAVDDKTPVDSDGNSPVPEIEYRGLHKDGTIRWFLNRATVLRNPNGHPYRIIGTITDITARKRAELALNSNRETLRKANRQVKKLVGKLLLAQEEERKRISRELHDGVNQQIAALGISVSKLKNQLSGTDPSISSQIANLETRILDASESIRELSHRLHSSLLQHVGLISALKSLCDDVTRDEGVTVRLKVEGEAVAISADAALCVYRITQESLRNVVKYSGAVTAEVTLAFIPGRLVLSVIDFGVGFDVQQTKNEEGLGLISIEERAAQLKGSAQIVSSPGKGTKIEVELPIGGHNERH